MCYPSLEILSKKSYLEGNSPVANLNTCVIYGFSCCCSFHSSHDGCTQSTAQILVVAMEVSSFPKKWDGLHNSHTQLWTFTTAIIPSAQHSVSLYRVTLIRSTHHTHWHPEPKAPQGNSLGLHCLACIASVQTSTWQYGRSPVLVDRSKRIVSCSALHVLHLIQTWTV